MNDPKEKKDQQSPDSLANTNMDASIELTEDQLNKIAGGQLGTKFASDKV